MTEKMVGVIIVTHGELAKELLNTLEIIVGKQSHMRAISVSSVEYSVLCTQMRKTIDEVNSGDGVLILTDMFGGTPSNVSLPFLDEQNVDVVTGVNLPMLVKLADNEQGQDVNTLKTEIVEYGKRNILLTSGLLSEKTGKERVPD